jgi:hypothetical protein
MVIAAIAAWAAANHDKRMAAAIAKAERDSRPVRGTVVPLRGAVG